VLAVVEVFAPKRALLTSKPRRCFSNLTIVALKPVSVFLLFLILLVRMLSGMGLTKVRFWDYFAGTALGIMVGTFIFTFFIGTLKEIWISGRWEGLLSWNVLISLALFIFSFFIPKLLKMARGSK